MRVFVSSTAYDLAAHRQVAERVILQMGWQPEMPIEHQSILGGPIVEQCCRRVAECDAFVLILGYRCGWIPAKEQGGSGFDSITAFELGTWIQKVRRVGGIQPLIMFAESEKMKPGDGEGDVAGAFQTMLRARVKGLEIVHPFPMVAPTDPAHALHLDSFASQLRTQLANLKALLAEHARLQEASARMVAEVQARRAQAALEAEKNAAWVTAAVAFGLGAFTVAALSGEGTRRR
ncbi:MAG: DUF4062 domain-containing protein [Planctomycetes bacterium]|nr:DUF4062 domain-containing protein [Planctomycetota bacterium]